ncbi:MAG: MarR family transcriptional regulator, partial [Sphingomonadales bacterium]|nr:MarR family transcriptional regulator [Sphingomonadales bacterium]
MLRISDSLGFLISDVSRLMRRRFDERARLVGATRAQWKTLVTLSRNEGINQGGLADLLEVEPITL